MKPAQQLALWADELRHISAMGARFSASQYDQENYRRLQRMAMEMLAAATDEPLESMEALRAPIFSRPTPFVAGDGAVIDETGRILLVRRADNGRWAMPGGALEVGETPAEGVVREVLEETGVKCRATVLAGIHDSRLCHSQTRHHLYHLLFLCHPLEEQPRQRASHANEVLEVGWFEENQLPDDLDPGHVTRIPEAYRVWYGDQRAHFDPHSDE
ncbi:MAG TPA: NUDIX hydrolase N-terminal domain-containing protein [Candidatus Sulfomarinibacteraceae bacterium]|nr:NUDIX hydrolase N-terminal domain-containing protein [Candidatus Sulfomarinibacteraceae bacterium]